MASSVQSKVIAWAGVGLAAALLAACNPGVDEDQNGAGTGTSRGALSAPPAAPGVVTETDDITQLRNSAFSLADSSSTGLDLTQELPNRDPTPKFSYLSRLEYTAIAHTGFLASIPRSAYAPTLDSPTAFGPDLGATQAYLSTGLVGTGPTLSGGFLVWAWGGCPLPPSLPRWSIDNQELLFTLPLATDTVNPAAVGNPSSVPPHPLPATPTNRYTVGNWANHSNDPAFNPTRIDDPIMAGSKSVHEYYLREPWIPDAGGSRTLTAWLNRYGRMGMARPDSELFGFGSILEAFVEDVRVLGEGRGSFLPLDPSTTGTASMFRATLAYRLNPARGVNTPSIWPGKKKNGTGAAPITYGWAYDPETGAPVGPAIHVIAEEPITRLDFGLAFEPNANAGGAGFQPVRDPTTGAIIANFDDNFDDYSKYPGSKGPLPTDPYTGPHFNNDPDPAMQIYPFVCDIYQTGGGCITLTTTDRPDLQGVNMQRTVLATRSRETFYRTNEVVIVPRVRPEFGNKLPNGTYRMEITVYNPAGLPQEPTVTADQRTRYFHVWNGSNPSFWRP